LSNLQPRLLENHTQYAITKLVSNLTTIGTESLILHGIWFETHIIFSYIAFIKAGRQSLDKETSLISK
jgi:hypothetical protein